MLAHVSFTPVVRPLGVPCLDASATRPGNLFASQTPIPRSKHFPIACVQHCHLSRSRRTLEHIRAPETTSTRHTVPDGGVQDRCKPSPRETTADKLGISQRRIRNAHAASTGRARQSASAINTSVRSCSNCRLDSGCAHLRRFAASKATGLPVNVDSSSQTTHCKTLCAPPRVYQDAPGARDGRCRASPPPASDPRLLAIARWWWCRRGEHSVTPTRWDLEFRPSLTWPPWPPLRP
jgi:hypothetical protein